MIVMDAALIALFWSKVRQGEGCWPWVGGHKNSGPKDAYGAIYVGRRNGGRTVPAHRFSWELHHGPIPTGLFVCHRCDNPPCVRPDHLFLGTNTDNMQDAGRKNRNCQLGYSRRTHCIHGHEYTAENTAIRVRNGKRRRVCRTCGRLFARRARNRTQEAA